MPIVICPRCGTKNRVDERAKTLRPVCGKCGAELPVTAATGVDGKPLVVTDATFESQVLSRSGAPVLLDCWAPWCGPCRMLAPSLEALAAESQGRYVVAKLNTDDNPRVAAQLRIEALPTVLVFKDGRVVERLVGLQPKPALAAAVAKHL